MTDFTYIGGEPVIFRREVTHEPEVLVEHARMTL